MFVSFYFLTSFPDNVDLETGAGNHCSSDVPVTEANEGRLSPFP